MTLGLGLAASGCAGGGLPPSTWEDDEAAGVEVRRRPRPHRSARLVVRPPTLDPGAAGERFDRALAGFSREALTVDQAEEAWRAWGAALAELERALAFPPGTLGRNRLLRARVVLEAERERHERRFGPFPAPVERRFLRAFTTVARRLRQTVPTNRPEERQAPLRLEWPVSPIILTSGFGFRTDPVHRDGRLGFHAGLDLAGVRGDVVRAAADGVVQSAGWNGGYGRAVVLRHPSGYETLYAHLSEVLVTKGRSVEVDQPVGLMGSSGRATGAHLHFELRRGGTPLDPLDFLRGRALSSLP